VQFKYLDPRLPACHQAGAGMTIKELRN